MRKAGVDMEKEDYLNDAFAVFERRLNEFEALVEKLGWHKMVESYSKNANHNMRRPVVKEEIVDLMRQRQKQVTGDLKELEEFARKEIFPLFPMKRLLISVFSWKPCNLKTFWKLGRLSVFQLS